MTKYQEYFNRMLEANKELFTAFEKLHNKYSQNQDELQEEFNHEGEKVMQVIREWETKLCSQSEKAGFGKFTNNLSEKFWAEVRSKFPMIDYVGVIVKRFSIKKIKL